MEAFKKTDCPNYLTKNCKKWTKQWINKKLKNPNTRFTWYTYNRIPVNQLLNSDLACLTQNHCSFCDLASLEIGICTPTIEHFRPKSKYPQLAFVWANLFLCCTECQKKGENFLENKRLLKPDKSNYSFDKYFIINALTGEIEKKPGLDDIDSEYAENTIRLYRLNQGAKPTNRKKQLDMFKKQGCDINYLDDFSYRFFIKRALNL